MNRKTILAGIMGLSLITITCIWLDEAKESAHGLSPGTEEGDKREQTALVSSPRWTEQSGAREPLASKVGALPAPVDSASGLVVEGHSDQAGVTAGQRLDYLLISHQHMLEVVANEKTSEVEKRRAQTMFGRRCIAAILCDKGRVEFPDERGQTRIQSDFNSNPDPDVSVFSADGAWYSFARGEFPIFDALTMEQTGLGDPVTLDSEVARLYDQALDTFGSISRPLNARARRRSPGNTRKRRGGCPRGFPPTRA